MLPLAAASSVFYAGLFLYVRRTAPVPWLAHPLAACMVAVALLNSAAHLYLTDLPAETSNFFLLIVGCGVFYCSTPWLLASLGAILGTWLAIAYARGLESDWLHFGLFAFQMALLAVVVHAIRLKTLEKLFDSEAANTAQRHALEAAVAERERAHERFRRLSEATFEAVFLHRNGRIVDVNEQGLRLFGYARSELQQMTMEDLLAPEARSPSPFKRPTLHSATGAKRDGTIHKSTALHKDGRRFPIEFGAVPRRPGEYEIDAAIIRDTTDRQRLEQRFRDFVENAVDYIYETDAAGRFTYANRATARLLGDGESLLGKDCYQFVAEEHRERIRKKVASQDVTGEPVLYQEFRVATGKNDMERWVGQIVQPVMAGDTIAGYRMVARNVTDRVMAVRQALTARREAEESSRSKSRFLSSMSHELRTPLNGILGFAQILGEGFHGPLNEKQRGDVSRLVDCSNHLLTLIEDLLDFTKADVGQIEIEKTPVPADRIVSEAHAMVEQRARERSITLNTAVDPDLRVMGDPRRLRQILFNLLSNAVKYSPECSAVETTVRADGDHRVVFSVADQGPGVPETHREKVFSEFFQSDSVRDGALGGSGIGLAVARKLIELHDGEIGCRARKGGGAEFWFTVAATREMPPETAQEASAGLPADGHPKGRVLVVDDIEVNAIVVREALKANGHTVEVATNGAEAIERARAFKPDVVLMDMRMPVMDGFQATQKLKSMEMFKSTPIVALTASVSEDAVADCLNSGCVEHLEKPIRVDSLLSCVHRHMKTPAGEPRPLVGGKPLRVLIADDMETNRDFMAAFFQRLPDEVAFATNGKEAVATALQDDFDVILMDVRMPEMDGLDATRAIRKERDANALPIVGLSGLGDEDDIQACLSAGMNDFVTKPIRFRRIVEVLEQYRNRTAGDIEFMDSQPGKDPS